MNRADKLRAASAVISDMSERAPSGPWWVYQSPDDGLVISHSEHTADVDSDGSCIAFFAYPDDTPDRRTYEGALETAKWIVLMDPLIAAHLTAWMDGAIDDPDDNRAEEFASAILRKVGRNV